jgi:single-strand DNA-binding protein
MGSLNRVTILGNLGAKPELKYLSKGTAVCELRIATNESWKDESGAKQEKVEWHSVVVWGPQAEACGQYLDKGRTVAVEGRLQTRSWEDKNSGETKYKTEIVANNVQFVGGSGKGSDRDVVEDAIRQLDREDRKPPQRTQAQAKGKGRR